LVTEDESHSSLSTSASRLRYEGRWLDLENILIFVTIASRTITLTSQQLACYIKGAERLP
jgi:hypothetical protein